MLALTLGLAYYLASVASCRSIETQSQQPQFVLERSWAMYSPFFAAEEYRAPPSQCEVTQVNIIQRHGARFPTTGAGSRIVSAVSKLKAVTQFTDPSMQFLLNFTYDLGTADLVPLGAAQSFAAGQLQFERYSALVTQDSLPFVRASSSDRVVKSATNWTAGFAEASKYEYAPSLDLILDENLNDTLDDAMCPNAGDSDLQTGQWLSVFAPPITARLNAGAPGANLTDTDTYSLLSLCPFHTVAKGTLSPFCSLFTASDFHAFEYWGDVDKYYNTGYGQPVGGRVQGVGYVNELLARLTRTPVQDHTQTNTTLDADPATFPLDRTIYADLSHDDQMIPIYAAIGLFPQAEPLDPTQPNPERNWLASRLVPFSARMVTERLACGGREYVRILVNDALQPLEFCGGDEDGLCELNAFVESQTYARNDGEGDFEKCFD